MTNDDHFPITIDVEETHVGKVLRLLDQTPGIVNIHLRMKKDQGLPVPDSRRNPNVLALTAPKSRAKESYGTLNDIVGHALSRGSMHYKILQEILRRNGYSPNSLYKAITELRAKKMLRKVAPGTYRLTEKGEKKYNFAAANNQGGNATYFERGKNNAKGVRGLLLTHLSTSAMHHRDVMNLITEAGYVKNNMYTALPIMIKEGLIAKTNDMYEITNSGREAVASQESTPPDNSTSDNDGEAK